jgi:3-methyladenine DNA glycosylase AlkD
MDMHHIEKLADSFRKNASSKKSEEMANYMKNLFAFYGINAPDRRQIQRAWIAEIPKSIGSDERWEIIHALWEKEEREMQLVAMDWLNAWPNDWISETDGTELTWLLTNKSWWDSVDTIATNYLGRFGRLHPEKCAELVAEWRESENNWLHRSCLLFQLKYKKQLNFELLKNLILQFKSNSNFFIQKAIGWSLRQHAKTDPNAVRQFILESNIQGLAKREASKYL